MNWLWISCWRSRVLRWGDLMMGRRRRLLVVNHRCWRLRRRGRRLHINLRLVRKIRIVLVASRPKKLKLSHHGSKTKSPSDSASWNKKKSNPFSITWESPPIISLRRQTKNLSQRRTTSFHQNSVSKGRPPRYSISREINRHHKFKKWWTHSMHLLESKKSNSEKKHILHLLTWEIRCSLILRHRPICWEAGLGVKWWMIHSLGNLTNS